MFSESCWRSDGLFTGVPTGIFIPPVIKIPEIFLRKHFFIQLFVLIFVYNQLIKTIWLWKERR
jgi:hypothetical protein